MTDATSLFPFNIKHFLKITREKGRNQTYGKAVSVKPETADTTVLVHGSRPSR
jgi:hypothetical protein